MDFRVDLDLFRGPLDLLLYLVRKHEVEIVDIPIALITEQYLAYLEVIQELDCNAVGDFLAMASLLVEIKSQQVLPRGDEVEDAIEDPREELVRRLLDYKKYRDAASILEERSRQWQQRYVRLASDLPQRERNLAEEPIQEVELWDLVGAFGRIIRDSAAARPSNIVYDDTPIQVYMRRIYDRLRQRGRLAFSDLFVAGACTNRPWWAFSWRPWNWSATPRSARNRTTCLARSGSWLRRTPPARWTCPASANTRPPRRRTAYEGSPGQSLDPQDDLHRGLFPRRGADLLAGAGAEGRFRPGGPALVVHGHAHLVCLPYPHRSRDGPADVRRPAADDEDGPAHDLPAGGGAGSDRKDPPAGEPAGPGPAALQAAAHQAGRRGGTVARVGGHRFGHAAHGALFGVRDLGAPREAPARVRLAQRSADPRPASGRHRRYQRGPRSAAGLLGR